MLLQLPSIVLKRIALCLDNAEGFNTNFVVNLKSDILSLSSLSKAVNDNLNNEEFWLLCYRKCFSVSEHQLHNLEKHSKLTWKQLLKGA